jgi:hypothetical protein
MNWVHIDHMWYSIQYYYTYQDLSEGGSKNLSNHGKLDELSSILCISIVAMPTGYYTE